MTPYLDMLGRIGYPTLHRENLLRLIGYWASVVGFIEGLSEECLAINVVLWESMNSHWDLVDLNRTLLIAERKLTRRGRSFADCTVWAGSRQSCWVLGCSKGVGAGDG